MHGERGQDERGDLAQKAAQEVGWGIGQEEKTVKPLKSNVDKTRFFPHFRSRFINIEVQDMQGDASLCRISMKSKIAETRIK